ncbi:MAG: hypothetical protein K9M99_01995 [Candidatus Cloacimonetes bacterium]|nr:hypothetical protein [Candidatus Cloacimonadota bacterium]
MESKRKRLVVLLTITAILAVVNFASIMYRSYISYKIPRFYPKDNWEVETTRRNRKDRPPPRLMIKEFEEPGIYYLLKDLECTYAKVEDIDFLQEVILDSIIPAGELLKEMKSISINGKTWCLVKKKSDGRSVIIPRDRSVMGNIFKRQSQLSDWFDDFNTEEILLSMDYDLQYKRNYVGSLNSFNERIEAIKYDLINEHVYRIFIQPQTSEKGSVFNIKGEYLKDLLEFQTITRSRDRENQRSVLREAIVNNEEIPFELKNNIMVEQIRALSPGKSSTIEQKTEYFNFLLMMIEKYPGKFISYSREYAYEIDQFAIQNAMIEFFNYFNPFIPDGFISFCDRVIAVAKNPETILRAYAAKTCALLKKDDPKAAQELALNTLKLYRIPYTHNPIDGVLNGQAALFCLKYELNEHVAPEIILEDIDLYYKKSSRFPEFRNNLLFIKAVITDLTDSPLEEVIKAYEKVNFDYPRNYGGYNYMQSLTRVNDAKSAIAMLKSQIKVNVTIDTPVYTRKYLLSEDSQVWNESGTLEITIIQHGLPEIEGKITKMRTSNWKKGIINGGIYWFTTDSRFK